MGTRPRKTPPAPPEAIGARPRNADELHKWLVRVLGITTPRRGVLARHSGSFQYLDHAFFEHAPSDCVVWANRGGGKTFLGAVATLLDMVFKPGIEIRVLGGSQVELLAASQTSIRGTRVQKIRCDEVDLFSPDLWDAAQLTTRSKKCGDVSVRGTVECLSTMHVPFGVMHRLVAEAQDGRRTLFRWGVVDSLEHCPPERPCGACDLEPDCKGLAKGPDQQGHISIDDAVTMKRRVSLAVWNAEMLCHRPRRGGTVLPEFDPAIHVFGALRTSAVPAESDTADARVRASAITWIGGMDFGIRMTVVLWAAIDAEGRAWVVDERAERDLVLGVHIEAMNAGLARPGVEAWPKPTWVGIDPAGRHRNEQSGASNAKLLAKAGFSLRTRAMGVQESLELLRTRLRPAVGEPRLFVHARCTHLIECLTCFHYPPDNPDSDQPVKGKYDHAVDALRYMIQNLERPPTAKEGTYL